MWEQVTYNWDGSTKCSCLVDGKNVAGSVMQVHDEDFFGFSASDLSICSCQFSCYKWGVPRPSGTARVDQVAQVDGTAQVDAAAQADTVVV
jgi:hypothetical protein